MSDDYNCFIIFYSFIKLSMKNFHLLSFVLGIASGLLVLVLLFSGMRLIRPARPGFPVNGGTGQQQGRTGDPNLSRMAERLGMTQAELQTALDSGKTFQDIAREKDITLPSGPGGRFGNGPSSTGSGASVSSSSSSISSVAQ